jgi:predicted Rossmann fold flavoprotein
MGATAFGYEVARRFGIVINDCRPALVPLTFDSADAKNYSDLSGISAEVVASTDSQQFREKMLITHRGLSGPAILQISSYWRPGETIVIDLAPEHEVLTPLLAAGAKRDLAASEGALRSALPARFAKRWLEQHAPSAWTNHALAELEHQIHHWSVLPSGTEGYDKAEVTAGGVDTNELSAKTMESRKVSGLFFIGEVLDVTGHLGGFNFQWAWASGFCAGQAV